MDIGYLLFLQDFRYRIHDAWTPFMQEISWVSISLLFLVPVFIYWCVNKKNGLFTLAAMCVGQTVLAVTKLTACVYRPWVRDARILPAGNALTNATGYSFPSGHTSFATTMYGGTALGFWSDKRTRWISVLCVLALLLTGFSRNYLGVHTPQDVLAAMISGVLVLWGMYVLFAYLTTHPEKENRWLLAGVVVSALSLLYITVKPYPMEYVGGKLLVDPQKMMTDAYGDIGMLMAFCVARYVEKRYIRFQATGMNVKGIVLGAVGLVVLAVLSNTLPAFYTPLLGEHWGRFAKQVTLVLYAVACHPFLIKLLSSPKKN